MKTILATLVVLLAVQANAEVANSGNSNNTIIIQPQITVKSDCCKPKVKIVKKIVEVEKIVEKIVEKPVYINRVVEVEKIVIKKVQKKNRVSLVVGVGPTHLDNPVPGRVDLLRGPVGGLQYQRSVSESWSIGIQGLTNQSLLGMVGYEF